MFRRYINTFLVFTLMVSNHVSALPLREDKLGVPSQLRDVLAGARILALHGRVVELGISSVKELSSRMGELRGEFGNVKCLVFSCPQKPREKAYYYFGPEGVFYRLSTVPGVRDRLGEILEYLGGGEDLGGISIAGSTYCLRSYAITARNKDFIGSCLLQVYPERAIAQKHDLLIDLDNYFASMSITDLGEKIRILRECQIRVGFIEDGLPAEVTYYNFSKDGVNYKIQFNPKRLKRSEPLYEGGPSKGAFCNLCPEFLPPAEEGFTFGDFIVYPNPFPIFNGHLTLVFKKHIGQRIDKRGLISAFDFVSSLKDYKVIYNHISAGASNISHLHLQAFPCSEGLPIENIPLEDLRTENGVIFSKTDPIYPAAVLVLTGREKDTLVEKLAGIINNIESEGLTFNLLITKLQSGELRVFVFLRNPNEETPSSIFGSAFGTMEMCGMIISVEADYESLLKRFGGDEETLKSEVLHSIAKTSASRDMIEHVRGAPMRGMGRASDINKEGILVFDVDGTILETKKTLENSPGMLKVLLDLLEDGFRMAIISGNSRIEQRRRIWEPIKKGLIERGILDKARNLIMYVNGGATKIVFDGEGNESLDEEYNRDKGISDVDIGIIKAVLDEMLKDRFGLSEDELAEWRRWLNERNDFPGVRFDSSWTSGVPVVSAEEVRGVLNSVWIETRDGAQVSIKLLPRSPRDIRMDVIKRIELELEKEGRSGSLIFRPAGFASIDINRAGVDKAAAIRDLEGKKIYFGNEFGESGNDLPVLGAPDVSVFSVGSDTVPGVRQIGIGPEATKRFLVENLEDLRFREALGILEASKGGLRIAVERFMGVVDIVEDQRIPGMRGQAEKRAGRALQQAAIKLATLGKPLTAITQDEFNRLLGISQVVLGGGFATRYHRLLHKGLGHIEVLGNTNMQLAIQGSYKSPGTRPVIAVSNCLILWLLKDEIIDELISSGKDIESFMIGKLRGLGIEPKVINGVIQKGIVVPDSIVDLDKKSLFFARDCTIVFWHHYGYGDAFAESLIALHEQGQLEYTRYKQYVFSEMAEAGLPDRSNASFIAYLEAVAGDNLITMGAKEADPVKEANDILTKRGNLFLDNGRLVAFTDVPDMPSYRKERLREALSKLSKWGDLSSEEREEIKRRFAVTDNGKILINANCGVFRNDIVGYFEDYYNYDEDGNKPGFMKIDIEDDGTRIESYQIDPKIGDPVYIAPDLVEVVARRWEGNGWDISDLPIGYVNTGHAPSSIKDMDSQERFNARWHSHVEGRRPFSGLKILRKQLFYTAVMDSRNFKSLLKVFGGDRDLLLRLIYKASSELNMDPLQVILGIIGPESYNTLGLDVPKVEKPHAYPHVVCLTGGTAIGAFLLEAIQDLGFSAEESGLLLAVLLPSLDDGGSTYEIINSLNRHNYGVLPPLGDQANVLLSGMASLDKVRYILGDYGRIRDEEEEGLEDILISLLKRTFNDTALQKNPDLLYFAGNLLAAGRIVDEYYVKKGIIKLEGASIRNLFLLAILHEYGLLQPDKSQGSPAIDSEDKVSKYNNALRTLAQIAGVSRGIVTPVSFEPATMYARYEDNVLIRREKDGYRVSLIKPGEEIDINGEKWILEEKEDDTFLINSVDPDKRYILATDGSGRLRRLDETDFHPLSIGGVELYIRPRLITMQTNITETANFSRITEVGLLDKFQTGKPIYPRPLSANPEAVRLINEAKDMIIVGPGNIFTSILPHFMAPEIVAALKRAKNNGKRVVWIMNGTLDNEIVGLTVSDIIKFLEKISWERLEDIFTDIIFTSFDESKVSGRFRQVLYQKLVLRVREPGMAAREAKKSRGPLVPTQDEMEELRRRGIVVHQDDLLRIKEVRDRATGKISYRITQDPRKVGKILKDISQQIIFSHDITEEWEVISYKHEEKRLAARIRFYGKGDILGELYLDMDPVAASINTCYLKSYKTGQGIARKMVSRAYVSAYYISQHLGWDTRYAHAYFTLSDMEEKEADYWPQEKWKWLLEDRHEVRIIRGLGLVKGEISGERYLDGKYGRYNDRIRDLREFVADIQTQGIIDIDPLKAKAKEIAQGLIRKIVFDANGRVLEGPSEAGAILASLKDIYGIGIFGVDHSIEVSNINIDSLEHELLMAILRLIEPEEDIREGVIEIMKRRRLGEDIDYDKAVREAITRLDAALEIYRELLMVKKDRAGQTEKALPRPGVILHEEEAGLLEQSA